MKDQRIAILYHSNFGRNDGPPLYYFNVLKNQMDFKEVLHLMPEGDLSRFGKFDYTFWVDYGEDGLPVDQNWKIPKSLGKTIYVCSDAHINDEGREYRFNKATQFDFAFFNQQKALIEYLAYAKAHKNKNRLVDFMPHAAEPTAYPKFEIIKKYDVSFIGHLQETNNYNDMNRVDFLDRMFQEFPNFYFGTRSPLNPEKNMFEDASKTFSMSKIVLNISITDDINMRVFETMSSGSFLLTNDLPTLKVIGEDGKHFVTYNSYDDAVKKAKYYIEHDDERETIAKAGHEHFLNNHTYKHRIESILSLIKGL